jgi:hypothetical protein
MSGFRVAMRVACLLLTAGALSGCVIYPWYPHHERPAYYYR